MNISLAKFKRLEVVSPSSPDGDRQWGDDEMIANSKQSLCGTKLMYAHYFASGDRKELIISMSPALNSVTDGGQTSVAAVYRVAGKRQAREIAAKNNATPWNF